MHRLFSRHLVIPLAALAMMGPGCDESSPTGAREVRVDRAMDAAEARGRATLPLFEQAFRDPQRYWDAFQIRYVFRTDTGYKSPVWLNLESIEPGGVYVCTVPLDEDPRITLFEPGQRVEVDSSEVTDWLFIDEMGRWVGGYTLRVTMDRSLGTGIDPDDNIHGGTEFRDLDDPDAPPGDGDD